MPWIQPQPETRFPEFGTFPFPYRHLIKNNSEVRPKRQEKSAGGETQLSLLGRHPRHDTLFRGEPLLR